MTDTQKKPSATNAVKLFPSAQELFPAKPHSPVGPVYDLFWHALTRLNGGSPENRHQYIRRESFVQFYSLCMCALFTNVPPVRATIIAGTAWDALVRLQGSFTFASLERCLNSLHHFFLNCSGGKGLVSASTTKQTFLYELFGCVATADDALAPITADPQSLTAPLVELMEQLGFHFKPIEELTRFAGAVVFPEDPINADGYSPDDEELKYNQSTTPNRFLVLAVPGSDLGVDVCGWLSSEFSCVNADAFASAVREMTAQSEVGNAISHSVAGRSSISTSEQAKLFKAVLSSAEAQHRGYAFHDIIAFDGREGEQFVQQIGLATERPNWVIDLLPSSSAEIQAVQEVQKQLDFERQQKENGLREEEENEARMKREKEEAKLEKRRKRAEAAKRREDAALAAENAEAQPPQEGEEGDAAAAAAAAAAAEEEIPPEEEEEEEAEPQQLDEDGNPIDPEVIQAHEQARQAERAHRKKMFDLKQLLTSGQSNSATPSTTVDKVPLLAEIVSQARAAGKYLRVGPQDALESIQACLLRHLNLLMPSSQVVAPFEKINVVENPNPEDPLPTEEELVEKVQEQMTAIRRERTLSSQWLEYCPVAYHEKGVVIQGSVLYLALYRKHFYYLSSVDALEKFKQNPRPFLEKPLFKPIPNRPILILKKTTDALEKVTQQEDSLVDALSRKLQYTPVGFKKYWKVWSDAKAEELRKLEEIERKRREEELLKKKLEEERAAAEAKARKEQALKAKAAGGKKGKEDPKAAKAVAEEPPETTKVQADDETTADGGGAEGEEAANLPPPTAEDRIGKLVEAEVAAKSDRPDVVVNGFSFEVEQMSFLFDERVLPETIVLIEYKAPKVRPASDEDEDAEEPAEEEEEEEEPEPEPEAEDAEGAEGTAPDPNRPPKLDPTNPKSYKRYINWLMGRMASEEGDAEEEAEAEPVAAEPGKEGDGTQPNPGGAEPPLVKRKKLPRQKFTIIKVNSFGVAASDLVNRIAYHFTPFKEVPVEAPEGDDAEEPAAEEDEEGGNKDFVDPKWGIPPTPAPKLGWSSNYCPVSLKNGVLIKGKQNFSMKYKNMRFLFAGAAEMRGFQHDPDFYLAGPSPDFPSVPPKLPPPRLWVAGIHSSGKTDLVNRLKEQYKIPLFTFSREFFVKVSGYQYEDDDLSILNTDWDVTRSILRSLERIDRAREAKVAAAKAAEQRQKEKEARIAAGLQTAEDEDEEDEDEPEKEEEEEETEEDRAVRISKAYSKIAADVLAHEPFLSQGYIMEGYPTSEAEERLLFRNGVIPERVVVLNVTAEQYLKRTVDAEYEKRINARKAQIRKLQRQRLLRARREKRAELKTWRRRNIGVDDPEEPTNPEDEEEIPEDPEPINREDVVRDLEAQYAEQVASLTSLVEVVTEQNIDVTQINADRSQLAVFAAVQQDLRRSLPHRPSMLEHCQIVRYETGKLRLREGTAAISAFGMLDPVDLFEQRTHGRPRYATTLMKPLPPLPPPTPPSARPAEEEPPAPVVDPAAEKAKALEEKRKEAARVRMRRIRFAQRKLARFQELKEEVFRAMAEERRATLGGGDGPDEEEPPAAEDEEGEEGAAGSGGEEGGEGGAWEKVAEQPEPEVFAKELDEEREQELQRQVDEESNQWDVNSAEFGPPPDADPPADDADVVETEEEKVQRVGWPYDGLLEQRAEEEEGEQPDGAADETAAEADQAAAEPPEEEAEPEANPEEEEAARVKAELAARKHRYTSQPRCAVWRHRAYFFNTDANLVAFTEDPWRYVLQPAPPCPPIVPQIVYLAAPAKVRARSAAEHLAASLGAVYLTEELIVRDLVHHPIPTAIAERLRERTVRGQRTIPVTFRAEALRMRLSMADVVRTGFVLEGIGALEDNAKAAELEEVGGLSPHLIFVEDLDDHEDAEETGGGVGLDPEGVRAPTRKRTDVAILLDYYSRRLHDVAYVPRMVANSISTDNGVAVSVEWAQVHRLLGHVTQTQRRTEQFHRIVRTGGAVPLFRTACLVEGDNATPVDGNRSPWPVLKPSGYLGYCPHQWINERQLIDAQRLDPSLQFSGCYVHRVYRFSGPEELGLFLSTPHEYTDVEADPRYRLPEHVPHPILPALDSLALKVYYNDEIGAEVTAAKQGHMGNNAANAAAAENGVFKMRDLNSPEAIAVASGGDPRGVPIVPIERYEFQSFCPVTLWNTKDRVGLQGKPDPICLWGRPEFSVEYMGKYYTLCSLECMDVFLKQPWNYLAAQLPERVPLPRSLLPAVHDATYLTHVAYEAIVRGLLAVGELRPVLPGVNPKTSALQHLAAHLRAYNPKNTPIRCEKYQAELRRYVDSCDLPRYFLSRGHVEEPILRNPSGEYADKVALWNFVQEEHQQRTQMQQQRQQQQQH